MASGGLTVPEIKTVQVLLFEVAVEIHAHPGDKVMILGDRVIGVDTSSEPAPVPVIEHSRHDRREDEGSTYDYYIGMTREAYREQALDFIRENPGITTMGILEKFGQNDETHPGCHSRLYAILRAEAVEGKLRRDTNHQGRGRATHWFLPSQEEEAKPERFRHTPESKAEAMERAFQFIKDNPDSRPTEIMRGLGMDAGDKRAGARFWWTLHDLVQQGRVVKEVGPGGNVSHYRVKESDEEQAA